MEEEEVMAVANWQVCFLKVGIKIWFLSYREFPELPAMSLKVLMCAGACRTVFSYHLGASFKQKF